MKTISKLVDDKFQGNKKSIMIDRIVYRAGAEKALQEFKLYCKEKGFWNSKLDEFLIEMYN